LLYNQRWILKKRDNRQEEEEINFIIVSITFFSYSIFNNEKKEIKKGKKESRKEMKK